jgi:hypothetical protein
MKSLGFPTKVVESNQSEKKQKEENRERLMNRNVMLTPRENCERRVLRNMTGPYGASSQKISLMYSK